MRSTVAGSLKGGARAREEPAARVGSSQCAPALAEVHETVATFAQLTYAHTSQIVVNDIRVRCVRVRTPNLLVFCAVRAACTARWRRIPSHSLLSIVRGMHDARRSPRRRYFGTTASRAFVHTLWACPDVRRNSHERSVALIRAVALMVVLVCSLARIAGAQTGGVIAGTIFDAQGGSLPGVTVVAQNTESGLPRTAVTGGDGRYRFAACHRARMASAPSSRASRPLR